MSNDIFKSMKNQMMPSDDCVNDLLAKIAALDASGETEALSNETKIIQFEPQVAATKTIEKTTRKSNRKAWGFSTAAVAAVIALAAIFTNIGDTPEDIKTSLDDIISNPEVVSEQDQINEDANGPVIGIEDETASKDENVSGLIDETDSDKDTSKSSKNSKEEKTGAFAKLFATKSNNSSSNTKGNTTTVSNNSSGEKILIPSQDVTTVEVREETKITPSEASTNELTWTREILADSAVKEIKVEGSNYVVDSSVSSVVTGTMIQSLSLDVPETDTTSADTVQASALKVANVSSELAVALDVDEYSGKLIYLNEDYCPENLGQFLSDAGIQSGTEFTSVVYTGDRIGYVSGTRITKSIRSTVIKHLYIKDAALTESGHYNSGTEKIVFVSTSNPTNTKISFGVSNNGYLRVVLANGNVYTFDIGSENANAFIDAALM